MDYPKVNGAVGGKVHEEVRISQSQLVYDQDSGRHYVIKEFQTTASKMNSRQSTEPEICRTVHIDGV